MTNRALYFLTTPAPRLSRCDLTVLPESQPFDLSCSEERRQIHGRKTGAPQVPTPPPTTQTGRRPPHVLTELILVKLPTCEDRVFAKSSLKTQDVRIRQIINPPSGQIMGIKAPDDGAKDEEVEDKSSILPTAGTIANVLH